MFAVMPGNSLPPGLSASMITGYVTTLEVVVDAMRTCVTTPLNLTPGYESTVNETGCPSRTLPMSASGTVASTWMRFRSVAMLRSGTAFIDETTVCPSSTDRLITTPFTGETIVQ